MSIDHLTFFKINTGLLDWLFLKMILQPETKNKKII